MMLVNVCNLEFEHCKILEIFYFNYESGGDQHVNYVLDLRPCIGVKLPEDGSLLPTYVGVGT